MPKNMNIENKKVRDIYKLKETFYRDYNYIKKSYGELLML